MKHIYSIKEYFKQIEIPLDSISEEEGSEFDFGEKILKELQREFDEIESSLDEELELFLSEDELNEAGIMSAVAKVGRFFAKKMDTATKIMTNKLDNVAQATAQATAKAKAAGKKGDVLKRIAKRGQDLATKIKEVGAKNLKKIKDSKIAKETIVKAKEIGKTTRNATVKS